MKKTGDFKPTFKVAEDVRNISVSQTNLSKALGLTTGRVNQLIDEGVVIRAEGDKSGGVYLFDSVKNYYSTNRTNENGLNYWQEKAKHENVKRKTAEFRLAMMEHRAYDAKTVELVLTEMLSNLRTQLLGLPSKLAPQVAGKDTDFVYSLLTREIEEKLADLSEYSPELFTAEEIVTEENEGGA